MGVRGREGARPLLAVGAFRPPAVQHLLGDPLRFPLVSVAGVMHFDLDAPGPFSKQLQDGLVSRRALNVKEGVGTVAPSHVPKVGIGYEGQLAFPAASGSPCKGPHGESP